MRIKKQELTKTSEGKITRFFNKLKNSVTDEVYDELYEKLPALIKKDSFEIKECSEKNIVEYYLSESLRILEDNDWELEDNFYSVLIKSVRNKLCAKYTSKKTFDNNIDIYFEEVKREYIRHPMSESDEIEFLPENRDIFIKNNLKLVINCAKRYQNLGLEFDDLIQAGNYGLLMAFDKFDKDRANLRFEIIKDINSTENEEYTYEDAKELVSRNFKYTKNLDKTLKKIPTCGFVNKEEFIEWVKVNVKTAVFASVAFQWIRAYILLELNKNSSIIHVPKTAKESEQEVKANIIRLDSINPHTDDCYHDNQVSDYINEEFAYSDEIVEEKEQNELYKDIVEDLLYNLKAEERRIIKKKYGIGYPYELSISEIAENEGLSENRVKYIIQNAIKSISQKVKNPEVIRKLLQ